GRVHKRLTRKKNRHLSLSQNRSRCQAHESTPLIRLESSSKASNQRLSTVGPLRAAHDVYHFLEGHCLSLLTLGPAPVCVVWAGTDATRAFTRAPARRRMPRAPGDVL